MVCGALGWHYERLFRRQRRQIAGRSEERNQQRLERAAELVFRHRQLRIFAWDQEPNGGPLGPDDGISVWAWNSTAQL